MNYKRIFKKSTIVYFIIILALGILFNSTRTKRDKSLENFTNRKDYNKVYTNNSKQESHIESFKGNNVLNTLIPIYETEKENYIAIFKNGEEIFNNIIDLSNLSLNNETELIKPSELSDLATNIKTDIDTLVLQIFNEFNKLELKEIDNYLENDYISDLNITAKKYSKEYPIDELIKKEINDLLIEKIDYTLENEGNSKNFKAEEFNNLNNTLNTKITTSNNDLIGLDKLNNS